MNSGYLLKITQRLVTLLLLGTALKVVPCAANTFVRLDYNLFLASQFQNTVFIELFDDRPLTRDNFLQYIDGGHFDGTFMHRSVPGFVLQGGGFYPSLFAQPAPINVSMAQDPVDLDGNPGTPNPTVNNEFNNLPFRSNLTGTIAMAKTAAGPNSATNQFFFNLANNSANLDNQNGGFTVFAQVVGNGMSLINGFAGLQRVNLNPDYITQVNTPGPSYGDFINNSPDGIRDFGNYASAFSEIPVLGGSLVVIDGANRTDYYSSTSNTSIPSTNLMLSNNLGFIEAGATFSGSGKLIVGVGKSLSAGNGANIGRPIDISGTLDPGIQVGAITTSTYRQFAGSTLKIHIGGETPGSLYDQVNVVGSATLNGTLEVSQLGSFEPSAGDIFTILTATNSISGNFAAANLPSLRAGLAWDLQKSQNNVKLVVLPDYNGNGTVDQGDLSLWSNNYGSTTNLAADGNGNGIVDGGDLLLWQRFFGEAVTLPLLGNIAAVPEPTTLALVAMGCMMLAFRRR